MNVLAAAFMAVLFLTDNVAGGAVPEDEIGLGFERLDLAEFKEGFSRIGRQQFKEISGGGGGGDVVGVGLIDALQRWADALEAQITLMRQEMSEMRADNRKLREASTRAAAEAEAAKRELKDIRGKMKTNQGEMVRLSGGTEAKVESLREDLRTFSESFSDFLGHYDKTMRQVRGNHSTVQDQLEWTKKSVKDLSSTLGDHNVDGLRHSLDELGDRVTVLAQADYILEERVRQNENRTDVFAETLNKELLVLRNSIVSPSAFRQALANVSSQVEEVRAETGVNVTAVAFSVKALEQTMKTSFGDVTRLMTAADDKTDRLTKDVQVQAKAFAEDFMNFQKSIDLAKNKYDELSGVTEGLKVRLREHSTLRQNLTSAMLKAMNELGGRIGETDSKVDTFRPELEQLNESLNTFVGQVGAEVIKLHTMDEELNIRLEDLETAVGAGGGVAGRNSNNKTASASSLSTRVNTLELKLNQIRGNELPVLLTTAAESRSNHSRLSSGLRGLEKHFVDLKREGFERGLAMATLNDTTRQLGDATRELAGATEALVETTAQLEAGVEELAGGLERAQRERNKMRSDTQRLEETLIQEAGKTDERLRGVATALTRLDEGQRNRTSILATDLANLANHTSELTANFSRMLVFAAANKAEVLELKVVGNTLEDKLDRLYDLHQTHQMQTQEAGDHAVGNITRLRGAASALERDVDAMTDRFQTLEQLVSDHLVSAGEMQSDVGRLRSGQGEQGAELQAVRLEMETARAAHEGLERMAASVSERVSALAAEVAEASGNLTRHERDIDELQEEAVEAQDDRAEIRSRVDANKRGLELADEQLQAI